MLSFTYHIYYIAHTYICYSMVTADHSRKSYWQSTHSAHYNPP